MTQPARLAPGDDPVENPPVTDAGSAGGAGGPRAARPGWTTVLAWSVWAIALALLVLEIVLFALVQGHPLDDQSPGWNLAAAVLQLAFPTVGALVASRLPRNPIGWLLLTVGLVILAGIVAHGYATATIASDAVDWPGGNVAAWLAHWLPLPPIFGCAVVLLVFPNGSLISRRWRPAAAAAAVVPVLVSLGAALPPGPIDEFPAIENPVGVDSLSRAIDACAVTGWFLGFVTILVSVASIVVRYRRASGDEREQLKWIAVGVAVLAAIWVSLFFVSGDAPYFGALFVIALTAFPISVGFAILRYRLYGIERVVSRTIVYLGVSAVLAGLYFAIVLALQAVFGDVTRGNDLAVAGSTLVALALFRPLRSRAQAIVDRRFARSRYDAERTLAAFGARLRDEVDLDDLRADLGQVVHVTVQPTHVSLWLRPPRERA